MESRRVSGSLAEGRPDWQVTRLALLRKRRLSIAERFFRSTSRPLKDSGGPSEPAPWLWRKHEKDTDKEVSLGPLAHGLYFGVRLGQQPRARVREDWRRKDTTGHAPSWGLPLVLDRAAGIFQMAGLRW